MKNRKINAKKGMTLIEVIISVTLLSILIVPISGFMLSSLKNNISSEKKREASYIGQKILEELKAYDYINLKEDSEGDYFELLDGDKIYKDSKNNFFEAEFERNIYGKSIGNDKRNLRNYNVKLTIEKDESFKYEDINNLEINNDADYKIDFINGNNITIVNSNVEKVNTFSGDIEINITKDSNQFNLGIYDKNNSDTKIDEIKKEKKSNKILLYMTSSYTIEPNIEINNDTDEVIYVYVIKQNNFLSTVNIITNKGKIVLLEEKEISSNNIRDMYIYSVIVRDDKENILFEGKSSNNINIK